MTTGANVQSFDAIQGVRASLISFVSSVADALTSLDSEMRRVQEWLEHDRPRHWKTQIRLANEQLQVAHAALHRCLMFPKTVSDRPACYEEREALKAAQARLAYCHEKAERVRQWVRNLQQEVFEYEGRISKLVRLVEIDVPQAIGVLEKILRQLEDYQRVGGGSTAAIYDDVALLRVIWSEETNGPPETDSKPISIEEKALTGQQANHVTDD